MLNTVLEEWAITLTLGAVCIITLFSLEGILFSLFIFFIHLKKRNKEMGFYYGMKSFSISLVLRIVTTTITIGIGTRFGDIFEITDNHWYHFLFIGAVILLSCIFIWRMYLSIGKGEEELQIKRIKPITLYILDSFIYSIIAIPLINSMI